MLSKSPLLAAAGVLIFLLLSISQTTYGLENMTPQSIVLIVFQDGAAVVDYSVAVDQNTPRVTFALIGSNYDDVLVNGADGKPLDFRIDQNLITVDTVGESLVTVEYTSHGLATASGALWSMTLDSPAQFRMTFPDGAAVVSVNQPPLDVATEKTITTLTMPAGHSEISYTLAQGASNLGAFSPVARQLPTSNAAPSSILQQQGLVLALVGTAIAAALVGVIVSRRRRQQTASNQRPKN